MKTPILYSFVRFRPYIETGEFVNVGLLMCEPQRQKITYRLVAKNDKRVNYFFYNSNIFADIREMLNNELNHLAEQKFDFTPQEMARFFHNYIDCKEGIVQYASAVVGIVDNPVEYFDKIYTQYIHLGGVKNESQENSIVRQYKELFKQQNNSILSEYKQHKVQGTMSKFILPLAFKDEQKGKILKGIKPLAFDQTETAGMIEHCDSWVSKVNRAVDEKLLDKNSVLFTLDTADTKKKVDILQEIKRTFDIFNISYVDWKDKTEVINFAQNIKPINLFS